MSLCERPWMSEVVGKRSMLSRSITEGLLSSCGPFRGPVCLFQLQAVVGAEVYTASAMDTDIDGASRILKNGINGAGSNTVATVDTEFLFHNDTAPFALGKGAGGAGGSTWCRVAGQAVICRKSGGQTTGGFNSNSCCIPGNHLVYLTGTGQ